MTAGAPHVLAGGVGDGFAEGLLEALGEGLGEGLVALGLVPQASEPRRATTAREANRLAMRGRLWALSEQFLQNRVRYFRIGLRRSFLEVGHQRAECLLLARPVVLDRAGVGCNHRLDR